MPTTTHYSLPYPAGTTGVAPDPRGDLQSLATTIDSNVYSQTNPAVLETADTGWSLSRATLASGWSTKTDPGGNTSGSLVGGVRKIGQRVEVRIRATRTGGTITPSSNGNISPDLVIFTLSSGYIPSGGVYDGIFSGPVGVTGGQARVGADGTVGLLNFYNATATITNGDIVQVDVDFLLN